jgi:hypothetical protein
VLSFTFTPLIRLRNVGVWNGHIQTPFSCLTSWVFLQISPPVLMNTGEISQIWCSRRGERGAV